MPTGKVCLHDQFRSRGEKGEGRPQRQRGSSGRCCLRYGIPILGASSKKKQDLSHCKIDNKSREEADLSRLTSFLIHFESFRYLEVVLGKSSLMKQTLASLNAQMLHFHDEQIGRGARPTGETSFVAVRESTRYERVLSLQVRAPNSHQIPPNYRPSCAGGSWRWRFQTWVEPQTEELPIPGVAPDVAWEEIKDDACRGKILVLARSVTVSNIRGGQTSR